MLLKFNDILEARRNGEREGGFTLIELLVVIIIIGILAAVAVPIYLNQQKTARDSATTSDVKNVSTNIQAALVKYPDATYYNLTGNTLKVGTSATVNESTTISLTQGTVIGVKQGAEAGTFVVNGYNPSGKNYTADTAGKFLTYDSGNGGLQKTSGSLPFTAPVAP